MEGRLSSPEKGKGSQQALGKPAQQRPLWRLRLTPYISGQSPCSPFLPGSVGQNQRSVAGKFWTKS